MMNEDPREILANGRMRLLQVMAVAMCILLIALDGFDVLSISFASPGIAADWGVDRAALGIVLSMELIGMAVGSVFIGGLADRLGRRPVILTCLVIVGVGMFLAASADNIVVLSVYRLATGLGIGGILAATNAMVAEFSNARRRDLCVTLMAGGYPLGAIIGGSLASLLLTTYSWHSVFILGGVMTLVFIPLVWFFLPESVHYLTHKRPDRALERINRTLKRLGHPTVTALPPVDDEPVKVGITRLFQGGLARLTVLLTLAYFLHIMTFYFILKWIPKIVVDMGFAPSSAGGVLVWANVGGALGAVFLGLLTQKIGVRILCMVALVLSAVMVTIFGRGQGDLNELALIAGAAGLCTNAGVVALYALFARSFPTEVRAGGTGFVIGIGRGGAALGPIVAGFLFEAGYGLETVAILMALGSAIGAAVLLLLPSARKAEGSSAA